MDDTVFCVFCREGRGATPSVVFLTATTRCESDAPGSSIEDAGFRTALPMGILL